jgi:hypothetical protein
MPPHHKDVDIGGIAVGACITVLALVRLNSEPLRLDEARTALLGDAILKTGLPVARSDGPSLFPPSELSPSGLCVLHTPLQFYLAAAARSVAKTPGSTRVPFALAGIAGAWGGIALGDHLMPGAGVYVGLTFLQVPVLLLIRQARYYPLVFAARVLAMWSLFLDRWWIAAVAGVVLAAAEWSGYLATLSASFVAAILGSWSLTEATGLLSGLCVIALWFWLRRDVAGPVPVHRHLVDGFLESFWTYFWKLQCYLMPVLTISVAAIAVRARVPAGVLAGLGWIVLAHMALRSVTPALFTRYLSPAIAPAGVGIGLALDAIGKRFLPLAIVLSVLLVATDLLHVGPLLLLPARVIRAAGPVRCPGGSHLARQAPEDLQRQVRPLMLDFFRELAWPPPIRAGCLARSLPAGSSVLIGQTEAPTLQAAAPHVTVVPWGMRKQEEKAWLSEHPPDFVVLGDIDRPATAVDGLPCRFRHRVLPAPDVLMANGETLERHLFRGRSLPVGVEVLERCSAAR